MSDESEPTTPASALQVRVLTAAILIPVLLGVLWLDSLPATATLLGGFLAIAGFEWATLLGWKGLQRLLFLVVVGALSVSGVICIVRFGAQAPIFLFACAWWAWATVAIIAAQRGRDLLPTGRLAWAMLGCFVLVPSYLALVWLQTYDRWLLMGLFGLIWTADTVAYFAGRAWGERRLASRISPGKTWAGALAAVAAAPLVGAAIAQLPTTDPLPPLFMAGLACLVVVASIVGDLFESLLKRRGGHKDSGTLLPGHGGVLDRIDSLLAAAPLYAYVLTCMLSAR